MSKPNPVAVSEPFSLLPPYDKYASYRVEWYNKGKRRTDGLSLRTTDLEKAKAKFFKHYIVNTPGTVKNDEFKDEPAATSLTRYYLDHVQKLPSGATALTAIDDAMAHFKDKFVSEIDASVQKSFVAVRRADGVSDSTINRQFKVFFAAFNYSAIFKHISKSAIPMRLLKRHWDPRTTPPKRKDGFASRRQLSLEELGRLCDSASRSKTNFRYFILGIGSGGRPIALRSLTTSQFDGSHDILDLNPVGREQRVKYHARIACAPILAAWLKEWQPVTPAGHYLGHRGQRMRTRRHFVKCIARSGVKDCVPYTLRHTVASWLAGHGVPKWQRSQFMGHVRPDGNTTDDYSHCSPDYLRECAAAIQKLFEAIAPYTRVNLMRHQWGEDQPFPVETDHTWINVFFESRRATCDEAARSPSSLLGGRRSSHAPVPDSRFGSHRTCVL